jgi:hypothetical protein
MRVEYCPTSNMIGDFNTKPLQGSRFRKHLKDILNLSDSRPNDDSTTSQKCVGATSKVLSRCCMRYKIRNSQLEVEE